VGPEKGGGKPRQARLSFETAVLVFDDPFHASKPDLHPDGDRWYTGLLGWFCCL
jgi:hypothetical protein